MESPNLTEGNIIKIGQLFPQCLTEKLDESGKTIKAIDFDVLRDCLSDTPIAEDDDSRYMLIWPGKRAALHLASQPTTSTLLPSPEESVDFDTTENLYIEGDNLEVLKLLRETYLGKVKMIYIDPPYNTGNDFVYHDNFSQSHRDYVASTDQYDEEGNRLVRNKETNGKFHTDWLNMMYPRLLVARDLLRKDGVIFISIDDNEVGNLRKVCDEIYNEDNHIATLVWKRRSGANDALNNVSLDHEYILVYSNSTVSDFTGVTKTFEQYDNPDNDPRGPWARDNLTCGKTASQRPNLNYPIIDPKTGIEYQCNPNHVWRFEKEKMMNLIAENKVIFPANTNGIPSYKRHKSEIRSEKKPFSTWIETRLNAVATKELRDVFGIHIFDYPKTIDLLSQIINQGTDNNSIILDFFSGSSTTAHAVMQLNAEDGGNRKFIMVQLEEPCSEDSEAFKAGYKNICEIGKERIRRAGAKIKSENPRTNVDIGFRVLKTASSNLKDVFYTPSETKQTDIEGYVDNIKKDRTSFDLLFQVMLEFGITLDVPITSKNVKGLTVYQVAGNSLSACFDKGVDEDIIQEMAKDKPLYAAFRDVSYHEDQTKINVEQIFKQLSPNTKIYSV